MTNNTTDASRRPTTRSLKERQREEREALILEAAYGVLLEKGYYEASIDEIAARVGISKGTVYLHFASKEDLVGALLEQQIVESLALVDQAISEETTVRARLEQILLHTYTGLQKERQLLPEPTNIIGLSKGVIEKRVELQARIAEVTEHIASLFEEGSTRVNWIPRCQRRSWLPRLSPCYHRLTTSSYSQAASSRPRSWLHMSAESFSQAF